MLAAGLVEALPSSAAAQDSRNRNVCNNAIRARGIAGGFVKVAAVPQPDQEAFWIK